MIFFTSGSTGQAEGGHPYGSDARLDVCERVRPRSSSPPTIGCWRARRCRTSGAFYVTFAALSAGATAIVPRTFDGDELLPLLREAPLRRCSRCCRPRCSRSRVTTTRAMTTSPRCGSAELRATRVSAELEHEFNTLSGMVIDEAYGLTETGLVTVSPPSGQIKIGSVGQVVPARRALGQR